MPFIASSVYCFNTQPPEGGWFFRPHFKPGNVGFQHTAARRRLATCTHAPSPRSGFNTQPPEGGWGINYCRDCLRVVSTHSRPKAAGLADAAMHTFMPVSTHSRPKAAGFNSRRYPVKQGLVSTHSRPKAAGASLKSLALSGFAALISLSSQEKREREYNTAFSVTPAFAIS